nr:hypothetical protein [Providencia sp. wls1943]
MKEQTGIQAGKGGFDITVDKHTQLDGAVIASTADKDKNKLDTGTLGFGDIKNQADYKVDSQSGGFKPWYGQCPWKTQYDFWQRKRAKTDWESAANWMEVKKTPIFRK